MNAPWRLSSCRHAEMWPFPARLLPKWGSGKYSCVDMRVETFFAPYRKGEELDHLAFRVANVPYAFRELVSKGARPEVHPFQEERYEFAFVSDPDGIWIELLGRVRS